MARETTKFDGGSSLFRNVESAASVTPTDTGGLSIQQLVFVHNGQRWRWIRKERAS